MNEPPCAAAGEAKTISFAGGDEGVVRESKECSPVREKCPDLNLELKISPPWQQQKRNEEALSGSTLCFACSLGIQKSKDCSCGSDLRKIGSSSNSGYDFLGLKSGVLDYRSLEMK